MLPVIQKCIPLLIAFVVALSAETTERDNQGGVDIRDAGKPSAIPYAHYTPAMQPGQLVLESGTDLNEYTGMTMLMGYGVYDAQDYHCALMESPNKDTAQWIDPDNKFAETSVYNTHSYALLAKPNEDQQIAPSLFTYEECKEWALFYGGYPAVPESEDEAKFITNRYQAAMGDLGTISSWTGLFKQDCDEALHTTFAHSGVAPLSPYVGTSSCEAESNILALFGDTGMMQYVSDTETRACVVEFETNDIKRPFKVCLPWLRVERTYPNPGFDALEDMDLEPHELLSAGLKKEYPNLCVEINPEKIEECKTGPKRETQCVTYYDATKNEACFVNPKQEMCFVDMCEGAIKDQCTKTDEIPAVEGMKNYSKATTVNGKEIKTREDIVTHIYECDYCNPNKKYCRQKQDVNFFGKECPPDENGMVSYVWPSATSKDLEYDELTGMLKTLHGTCPDGTVIDFPIDEAGDFQVTECAESEIKMETSEPYHKTCSTLKESYYRTISTSLTEVDMYADDPNCLRFNSYEDGRPGGSILMDWTVYPMATLNIQKAHMDGTMASDLEAGDGTYAITLDATRAESTELEVTGTAPESKAAPYCDKFNDETRGTEIEKAATTLGAIYHAQDDTAKLFGFRDKTFDECTLIAANLGGEPIFYTCDDGYRVDYDLQKCIIDSSLVYEAEENIASNAIPLNKVQDAGAYNNYSHLAAVSSSGRAWGLHASDIGLTRFVDGNAKIYFQLKVDGAGLEKNIKLVSEGFDLKSQSPGVWVDGVKIFSPSRGWGVVVFDPQLRVIEAKTFDTFVSQTGVDDMTTYLNGLASGSLVAFVTWDEPSLYSKDSTDLISAMEQFGATATILQGMEYRSSYILLGVKNGTKYLEAYSPRFSVGPSQDTDVRALVGNINCSYRDEIGWKGSGNIPVYGGTSGSYVAMELDCAWPGTGTNQFFGFDNKAAGIGEVYFDRVTVIPGTATGSSIYSDAYLTDTGPLDLLGVSDPWTELVWRDAIYKQGICAIKMPTIYDGDRFETITVEGVDEEQIATLKALPGTSATECGEYAECLNGDIIDDASCIIETMGEPKEVDVLGDLALDLPPVTLESEKGTIDASFDGAADIFAIYDTTGGDWGYRSTYLEKPYINNITEIDERKIYPITDFPVVIDALEYNYNHVHKRRIDGSLDTDLLPAEMGVAATGGAAGAYYVGALAGGGIGAGITAAVVLWGKTVKISEATIQWSIVKPYDGTSGTFDPITRRNVNDSSDPRMLGPDGNIYYNGESTRYTGQWLSASDANKVLETFLEAKKNELAVSGYEQSTIDGQLVSVFEESMQGGYKKCTWYTPPSQCSTTKTYTDAGIKDITKPVNTYYRGATTGVSIAVPYVGSYEVSAWDRHGNQLATSVIGEADFIRDQADNWPNALVSFAYTMTLADGISEGNRNNACRDHPAVEWGGGASGIFNDQSMNGITCSKSNDAYVTDHSAVKITVRPTNHSTPYVVNLDKPLPYAGRVYLVTMDEEELRMYLCYSEVEKCEM